MSTLSKYWIFKLPSLQLVSRCTAKLLQFAWIAQLCAQPPLRIHMFVANQSITDKIRQLSLDCPRYQNMDRGGGGAGRLPNAQVFSKREIGNQFWPDIEIIWDHMEAGGLPNETVENEAKSWRDEKNIVIKRCLLIWILKSIFASQCRCRHWYINLERGKNGSGSHNCLC